MKVRKFIGFDATEDHRTFADGKGIKICPEKGLPDYGDRYQVEYPLREWGLDRAACGKLIVDAGLTLPPKSACFFCLTGETEVLTDRGLRNIGSLAGKSVKLLVPIKNGHFKGGKHGPHRYQSTGAWRRVAVRSFGKQRVWLLKLRRGPTTKVIRCTAEHRWVLPDDSLVTTNKLRAGQRLRFCHVPSITCSGSPVALSPPAVMQGFTFGDGTVQTGRRPARARFYDAKDFDMLPWFANCRVQSDQVNGKEIPAVSDLPRFWKKLPPITESRSFLLGWLAGYFAADGHVDKKGAASIESVDRKAMQFVRDVCHLIGVRCGQVAPRYRVGFNGRELLYRVTVCVGDLPSYFWLLNFHRDRTLGCVFQRNRNAAWRVESVKRTRQSEQVFCAVVPGDERFVLADGLVTGNCPAMKQLEIEQLKADDPEMYALAIEMERLYRTGHHFRGDNNWTVRGKHKVTKEAVEYEDVIADSSAEARTIVRRLLGDITRPYQWDLSPTRAVPGLGRNFKWEGLQLA